MFYTQDVGESQMALKLRHCHPMYRCDFVVTNGYQLSTQRASVKRVVGCKLARRPTSRIVISYVIFLYQMNYY